MLCAFDFELSVVSYVQLLDEHKQIVCDLREVTAFGEPKSILSYLARRLRVKQNSF